MSPFCSHSSLVHFVIPSLPPFPPCCLSICTSPSRCLSVSLSILYLSFRPPVPAVRLSSRVLPLSLSLSLFDCRWPCMFSPSLIASINHASRLRGIVLHTLPAQSVTSVNLLPQSPLRQLFLAIVGSMDLP